MKNAPSLFMYSYDDDDDDDDHEDDSLFIQAHK